MQKAGIKSNMAAAKTSTDQRHAGLATLPLNFGAGLKYIARIIPKLGQYLPLSPNAVLFVSEAGIPA